MSRTITSQIVVAYSLCPQKAFLLLCTQEQGTLHEYEQILHQRKRATQNQVLKSLLPTNHNGCFSTLAALTSAGNVVANATLLADGLEAVCGIVTKVWHPSSSPSEYSYEPTIFVGTYSITKEQKLELLFAGYVLGKIQGKLPEQGKIIGANGIPHPVKLGASTDILLPLLQPLQKWAAASPPQPPPLILNKHCPSCQFHDLCKARAEKEDNLSLLSSIKAKNIQHYAKKGIFTVKQLSYVYKPRRPSKRAKNVQATHKPEFQALALRMGKVYLHHIPTFSRQPVELFFDMEGIPDQQCYYLIGLLISQENTSSYHVFWAETVHDEGHMWRTFLEKVNHYPNAPLYHYGSYDPRALVTLAKRYGGESAGLEKRLVNITASISGKVYFPVQSNSLKEIGKFLEARWTAANASGLQSLVWRHYWDETREMHYQDLLVTYNQEDCLALKLLVDELSHIKESAQTLSHVDFINQPKRLATPTEEEVHTQFESLLEFAHTNYDKNKIHFRPDKADQTAAQEKKRNRGSKKGYQGQRKVRPKATKVVHVPTRETCPYDKEPLLPSEKLSKRVIIDLITTKNGIRKTITEYVGIHGYCAKCYKTYAPPDLKKYTSNQIYGYRLQAWLVYQRVALRMPYKAIAELMAEQFHEIIPMSYTVLAVRKLSVLYAEAEQGIIQRLLASPFLHADETPININGSTQYVWTFTTDTHVIFKLSKTREAITAQEFLKDYHGILISDFFSGYDAISCTQQKCWVHLIRDLNDDLWHHPFDSEYEAFVSEVRNLIIPIMEAVQKYGLKKRHLQKFKQQVNVFYDRVITEKHYTSELIIPYQKRFVRYRESLFTFIEHDGIPWHNNTAERALRHIGRQQVISMSFREVSMHEYLRLLSIRQTCRFQEKSFFQFLLSREKDIDQFKKSRSIKRSIPLDDSLD